MGPVDFMRTPGGTGNLYAWSSKPQAFVFSVTSGQGHAAVIVRRRALAAEVTVTTETVATTGFFGRFYDPAKSSRHAAVLEVVFGLATTGTVLNPSGGLFASHGYPTLLVSYLDDPGLPGVSALPKYVALDYFAKALRWLARQPGVDPSASGSPAAPTRA
jgi:hypothetical protein